MPTDIIWQLILLIVLLSMSAFFSASEMALTSINRIKLRQLVEKKHKAALLIDKMLEAPDYWLSTILIGNNVVNIGASALAASIAIRFFGNGGVGIATGVMAFFVLVFSEITPKSFAGNNATGIALAVARPIYFLSRLLRPLVLVLSGISNFLLYALGMRRFSEHRKVTEEELKTLLNVSHEEGQLETKEKELLEKVFEFGDEQVRFVMVPRTEISAIASGESYENIREAFNHTRFSRLPVYENSPDNIIGLLHMKDFFLSEKTGTDFNLSDLLRKSMYTIESKRIAELFEEMRSLKQQMAVVVDEYGGTAGIITTQDIVEVIFGDIDDEYDIARPDIEEVSPNLYYVRGATRLKDLNEHLEISLNTDDYETIGGFIIGKLGTFPGLGETVMLDGLTCQILDRSKTKINWISVKKSITNEDK